MLWTWRKRPSPVSLIQLNSLPGSHLGHRFVPKLLRIAVQLSQRDAVLQNVEHRASGLKDIGRKAINLRIQVVADDNALVGPEHDQALVHVVQRRRVLLHQEPQFVLRGGARLKLAAVLAAAYRFSQNDEATQRGDDEKLINRIPASVLRLSDQTGGIGRSQHDRGQDHKRAAAWLRQPISQPSQHMHQAHNPCSD